MLTQGNNLSLRDQGGSRGRSRTQEQKTRTISTCWSNPGSISLRQGSLYVCCTMPNLPSEWPTPKAEGFLGCIGNSYRYRLQILANLSGKDFGWNGISETPEPLRNTANGIFQRKDLWIFNPSRCWILQEPCDLRSKIPTPPSQEWRKIIWQNLVAVFSCSGYKSSPGIARFWPYKRETQWNFIFSVSYRVSMAKVEQCLVQRPFGLNRT